jgi:uncharacterized protein YndB with AHSA1/START domain
MTAFQLVRTCPAAPATVWDVLTDFAGHERWIPLTTMRVDQGAPRVGWGWAGVSGLGPLSFADSMVLSRWEPPADEDGGRFSMVKTGRVLDGWADVRVDPAPGGTVVTWSEDISLRPRPLRRATQPLVDRVGAAMFARALDAMLDEAARRASRSPA